MNPDLTATGLHQMNLSFSNKLNCDSGKPARQKKLNWDMSRGNWVDADFRFETCMKNSVHPICSAVFVGSDLSASAEKQPADGCDFSGSDFSNSHLQRSYLNKNNFKDCKLIETEFSESYLYGCDFTGADFTGVVIKSGGFSGVTVKSGDNEKNTISGAVLNRTSFIDTQIADVVFTGPMDDCYFENCAFTRVIFRNATLMNTLKTRV
ncbi:MAG: pentapeptide repeat-containing protein [Bacteroidales bacterium]|nr:pentapeptide repeat-containing protein [Bacteroidales bacterium]